MEAPKTGHFGLICFPLSTSTGLAIERPSHTRAVPHVELSWTLVRPPNLRGPPQAPKRLLTAGGSIFSMDLMKRQRVDDMKG